MSLWVALRLLGYHPYHIGESIRSGPEHVKALRDAIVAADTDQALAQADFERLWGQYDVSKCGTLRQTRNEQDVVESLNAYAWATPSWTSVL